MLRQRGLTIGQRSFETRKAANRFLENLLYDSRSKWQSENHTIHFSGP